MKTTRADRARAGDLIAGTVASGDYPDGPRRLHTISRAPEHEKRRDGMTAHLLTWTDGRQAVYYGDTRLLLAQRP